MFKKIFCMTLMAMFAFGAQAQDDWTNFKRYHDDNEVVKTLPQDQRKVVFIGNSITDNWYSRHGASILKL